MIDNSHGIFQFVGSKEKVFVPGQVLLDLGAQSLMLGASTIAGVELTKDTLEDYPWTISTSMGETKRYTCITKAKLSLKLNQEDVEDVSFMKVKTIVTEAKSYDVLVRMTVMYPMRFILDFWKEIAVTDHDGKQKMGARCSCQLDLFEFLLGTLRIYMLSLAM